VIPGSETTELAACDSGWQTAIAAHMKVMRGIRQQQSSIKSARECLQDAEPDAAAAATFLYMHLAEQLKELKQIPYE